MPRTALPYTAFAATAATALALAVRARHSRITTTQLSQGVPHYLAPLSRVQHRAWAADRDTLIQRGVLHPRVAASPAALRHLCLLADAPTYGPHPGAGTGAREGRVVLGRSYELITGRDDAGKAPGQMLRELATYPASTQTLGGAP